jgi:hypothetical protein
MSSVEISGKGKGAKAVVSFSKSQKKNSDDNY